MNIAIDVRKHDDFGIGTHIRNVVLPAARLCSESRFTLFCDPHSVIETAPNFELVPEHSGKYSLAEQFALSAKSRSRGIELFHAPHYTLPLMMRGKTIVTIHDLIHLKFREFFPYWKVEAAKMMIARAVRKADIVISVSKTTEADIHQFEPESKRKTKVVYNRLDPNWFSDPGLVDLSALGVSSEFILFVGNFKKHKGIDTLMRAYSNWKNPPQLVMVGRRPGSADVDIPEEMMRSLRVKIFGTMSFDLLRSLYRNALLFVFPSLYEGFGYPPLEAMACGAPVLSSNAPAMKEILADAVDYFPAGDSEALASKMKSLVLDSGRRSDLVKSGKQKAAEYSGENSIVQMAEIYRSFAR